MGISYTRTRLGCYIGYITQAIINSLPPLLFVTMQNEYGVSLDQLTLLISLNFGVQLVVDLLSTKFVDKIGYRAAAILAHICACAGIAGIGLFPGLFARPFPGIALAMCVSAAGGGIIEVIISPITEAIPGGRKAASMSLLHSFFSWGCVAVVALSTVYFNTAGMANWRWLPLLWALPPLANIFLFAGAPLKKLVEDHERVPLKKLFGKKLFLLFLLLMLCAGAAEQAMSQWASLFAESGLNVSKTLGDLLGPMAFAALMGISRVIYGARGGAWKLESSLAFSALLCFTGYMATVFSPHPLLSLAGCSLCGFSVGLLWPGTLSLTSRRFPAGGTAMFAMLALSGDLGCALGPGLVGLVSGATEGGMFQAVQGWFAGQNAAETGLKTGLLFASVFAVVLAAVLSALHGKEKKARPGRMRPWRIC